MPIKVKIPGGWKVVDKRTGRVFHTYRGHNAKSKAVKVVRKGY